MGLESSLYIYIYILPYKWLCLALQLYMGEFFHPVFFVGFRKAHLALYPKNTVWTTKISILRGIFTMDKSSGIFLYTPFPWYDLDRDGLESEVAEIWDLMNVVSKKKSWMLDVCLFSHPCLIYLQNDGDLEYRYFSISYARNRASIGEYPCISLLCFKFRVRCLDSFHLCFFERWEATSTHSY